MLKCIALLLQSREAVVMDFNLLTDSEARSPALSLSDSGTPQHDQGSKGQDNSGSFPRIPYIYIKGVFDRCPQTEIAGE